MVKRRLYSADDELGIVKISQILKCSHFAVKGWCERGELPFYWGSCGTRRKVRVGDVVELMHRRRANVPKEFQHVLLPMSPNYWIESEIRRHSEALTGLIQERDKRREAGKWEHTFSAAD